MILPPLNALLSDLIIPTSLVLTIRDTEPAANPSLWLQAIAELEDKMQAVKSRGAKVKAARELESVIEALALKAMHALPPFLLTLIRPLRSASKGLSTNLAVMQTSLLLKYQPFYAFLARQSQRQAKQVERGYVNAARGYYETAMRRYARALTTIRLRTPQTPDLIGVVSSEAAAATKTPDSVREGYKRLAYADLDMDDGAVVLAYMADDKELVSEQYLIFADNRLFPSKRSSGPSASCSSTTHLPSSPSLCASSRAQLPAAHALRTPAVQVDPHPRCWAPTLAGAARRPSPRACATPSGSGGTSSPRPWSTATASLVP